MEHWSELHKLAFGWALMAGVGLLVYAFALCMLSFMDWLERFLNDE